MQRILYIIFGVIAVSLGIHIYNANAVRADLAKKLYELSQSQIELEEENKKITEDIEYLSDPHNLEKELRARYNYRAPNEKMIIVVPPSAEE